MSTFGTLTRGQFPSILTETHASPMTQPFWDAAKEDRLVAPKCASCGTFRLPPSPYCFVCRQRDVEWVELPGTGAIYSFTVVRHPLHPDLADACPYVSGVVELDGTQGAGARMLVNIIGCDPDTVKIGDRVAITWEHVNDEMSTPRFRPIPA
ncbi:Zn-ribbon domain-containing OB-fold protein [Acidiferrimicrobium sp. IK]|uniref:Zn-ribbon domain-containing OB-fold protein n=1 Tax=Acidiferrimicrobium sp. IK TaxID=2871700 RepID=UPI0021CB653A|nr:Zn-ribbon domain-containing OB-fold protein [Acidiferrimicrobium sp. IK]MCU4184320.1 Zn-ribbon domain-containing OB-fold protein [Acidiferrimicrobium sp. IK]